MLRLLNQLLSGGSKKRTHHQQKIAVYLPPTPTDKPRSLPSSTPPALAPVPAPAPRSFAQRVASRLEALLPCSSSPSEEGGLLDIYVQKLVGCSEHDPEEKAIVALVLLARYVKHTPSTSTNRLLVISTAFLLAAKLVDDYVSTRNCRWALISGHTVDQLSDMELAFCVQLEWRLFVCPSEFERQRSELLL